MRLVDQDGKLLGVVNVIDAMAAILCLVLIASITGVVAIPSDEPDSQSKTLTVTTQFVVERGNESMWDSLAIRESDSAGIISVEKVGKQSNGDGSLSIKLVARLNVTTSNGQILFRGEPLYIGRELILGVTPYNDSWVVNQVEKPVRLDIDAYLRDGVSTPTETETPAPTSKDTKTPELPSRVTETPAAANQSTADNPGETQEPTDATNVTLWATVSNGTVKNLTTGVSLGPDDISVQSVRTVARSANGTTVIVYVELRTTEDGGAVFFRGIGLSVGDQLRLRLGGSSEVYTIRDIG